VIRWKPIDPRGESKKFNIARGESKEKKLQEEKQNSPILQGVSTYLPYIYLVYIAYYIIKASFLFG
jgi:hypothetical protein